MSTDRLTALDQVKGQFAAVFGDGTLTLNQMRANLDSLMTQPTLDPDVSVVAIGLNGVDALRVSAGDVDDRVLVWLHGGGYVMGSAKGYTHAAAAISRALGSAVVVPDYR